MSGSNKDLGQSIIKAVRLAIKDIDTNLIEIIPKDTASRANQALRSAYELKEMGVKVVIGPVFHKSLIYLDEVKDLTFLSLTNKTLDIPIGIIHTSWGGTPAEAWTDSKSLSANFEKNEIKNQILDLQEIFI